MKLWWLSSKFATFCVETDDEYILTKVAPIAWKFKGTYLDEVISYMKIDTVVELKINNEV